MVGAAYLCPSFPGYLNAFISVPPHSLAIPPVLQLSPHQQQQVNGNTDSKNFTFYFYFFRLMTVLTNIHVSIPAIKQITSAIATLDLCKANYSFLSLLLVLQASESDKGEICHRRCLL